VKPAIYDINTNTFVNDTETVISGVVIGYVIVDYIHSGTVYTIKDTFVYDSAKLLSMSKTTKLEEAWKYLSEATDQTDWESRVDGLGIENSFTFLAAYNAFITNLKAENITAGTGDGTTGGFRFRAMSREDLEQPYNATTNPSVFDVMYNDRKVLEVDAENGNIMFGNYDTGSKSGGILYDYVNDKLLGNVAYDQWDLVIESDADLALLTTGTTTYENVLIAPGTYNINAQLNLSTHGVKRFVGCGVNQSVLNINYIASASTAVINCGDSLLRLSSFRLTTNKTQTNNAYWIYFSGYGGFITTISDLKIDSMNNKGTGLQGYLTTSQNHYNVSVVEISNCLVGMSDLVNITSCYIHNCPTGLNECNGITSLRIYNSSSTGFYNCGGVSSCYVTNSGTAFYLCYRVSSCSVVDSTIAYDMCFLLSSCHVLGCSTAFISCFNIASSKAEYCNIGWSSCHDIDYDSTNCDQQWTLGSQAINHGASYVLPRGVYQVYKRSAGVSILLEVKDTSTWNTVGDVFTGGGYVASDGTNMRLTNNSDDTNATVYWRKKP
jgi:hypothetical protein